MKSLALCGFLFVATTIFSLSCQKELSQESNLNNAVFSLHDDTSKACYPVSIFGTYYNGVSAARDTNYITVAVNVKATGNYTITTDSLNGFYFSKSGFFSKTGLDTLVLKAVGTPILLKVTDFTFFPADSLGSCGFSIDVKDSTGTGLGGIADTAVTGGGGITPGAYSANYTDPNPASDGQWHFNDSTNSKNYGGTIQLGGQFVDNGDGTSVFQCQGFDSNNPNAAFTISIQFPGSSIVTGSYQMDGMITRLFLTDFMTAASIYDADASTINEATDPSYINITSYDVTTKRIKGSFRCWAKDSSGNPALLKGSFNTTVVF